MRLIIESILVAQVFLSITVQVNSFLLVSKRQVEVEENKKYSKINAEIQENYVARSKAENSVINHLNEEEQQIAIEILKWFEMIEASSCLKANSTQNSMSDNDYQKYVVDGYSKMQSQYEQHMKKLDETQQITLKKAIDTFKRSGLLWCKIQLMVEPTKN
ncbi:unnamed protein product [Rotaria socialis]|uniref:Uncharacterized protein n=1 Tax=Rotaria socialis TaxID=392032 RepID=A0A820TXR9_9BILA|nr:unnamed protein product [Rotaria socialis]CAF3345064.1 unnamed protein product [Rotaria socialis]CAF4284214.1 unnamed protein product [Rotaria socialis]CAF4482474.1 unnamed protein product [Rotaria socialis]